MGHMAVGTLGSGTMVETKGGRIVTWVMKLAVSGVGASVSRSVMRLVWMASMRPAMDRLVLSALV